MAFDLEQLRTDGLAVPLPQPGLGKTRFMRRLMALSPIQDEPVRRRTRKPSRVTLIKQAERAGLAVTAIRPDGTIVTGKVNEPEREREPDANEWDGVVLQ